MIGPRLREARLAKKYTQEALAKLVNTKKTTISNYETGYSRPSPEMMNDLADILGVSIDYLYGRTDKREGTPEKKDENINTSFHDFDNITEEEMQYLEDQLEIFRKYKRGNDSKEEI